MKREGSVISSPVGVGVITVITVLLVLSLSIFSALTLSTARADLALSRRNADTVTAYYAADAQAAALYRAFEAGGQAELEATLPVTDHQNLYLHLIRNEDGSVEILSWQTVAADEALEIDDTLPVWGGSESEEYPWN